MCKYWIVNRNNTANDSDNFLWAPETRADGKKYKFYSDIRDIKDGDIIYSLSNSKIEYVGLALGFAYKASKPDGLQNNWKNEGYKLDVKFERILSPILLADIKYVIKKELKDNTLFTKNCTVKQGAYIAPIGKSLAAYIEVFLEKQLFNINSSAEADVLRETENQSLVRARLGQNIFKKNLYQIENSCRVTKTSDITFLIASHIKPWRDSSDKERLDGYNGLLLAPHIDKLFDNGYISFEDDGQLIVSPHLSEQILFEWNIKRELNVGKFKSQQKLYLDYHRKNIFKN